MSADNWEVCVALCPYCGRPVDLLDELVELWGSEWWHSDCMDDFQDEPYRDDEEEGDDRD